MPAVAMLSNGTLDVTSTLQKLHRNDSFDTEEDCGVFGVLLTEDRRSVDSHNWNKLVLGSIVIGDSSIRRRNCTALRQALHANFPNLNGNFAFLSKEGWPIPRQQEGSVRASKVINERNSILIQRTFGNDKCRLAVVTQSQVVTGFIFCDLNATLQQVREAIGEQLKDVRYLSADYQFTERNAWPVTRSQESQMLLCDIWSNDSISVSIRQVECRPRLLSDRTSLNDVPMTPTVTFLPSPLGDEPDGPGPQHQHQNKKHNRITVKSIKWVKNEKSGRSNSTKIKNELGLVAKPILISYVRAEAASHAIGLKEVLAKRGFSVYLDVHEIRTGNDWQDALNYAVTNCTVFVPLITPQYGMTQWTNREVKLADVLHKFIIPVNFLDRWPPECLAIQFASTQYVSWKPMSDHENAKPCMEKEQGDCKVWERELIEKVADEICNRVKLMFNSEQSIKKLKHTVKVRDPKYGPKVPSMYALDNNLGNILEVGGEVQNKFVVISSHPRNMLFAHEAKTYLTEKGFTVWMSVEWMEETPDSEVFLSSVPLSTIPEGELHNPSAVASLNRMDTDVSSEKQGLCRLSSQLSSFGGMTETLSPENIERLTKFQKKVDQAGFVVVLISQAYTSSSTSLQQIFYCEHRKKMVLIRMDDQPVRSIFSMLMGHNDTLEFKNNKQILPNLYSNVKRLFNNQASLTSKEEASEAKMQYLVNFMKKNLPEFNHCVYIAGSTKLQSKRSEEICQEIGKRLAKTKDVNIVTNGFLGAGDTVARAFEEAKLLEVPNNYSQKPVVHILPNSDQGDYSEKACQNDVGDFESVNYGNTVFIGDSVKERESAVARLFDICIVVEGGPGAAHEVEEFIWNDHFVIPIISSGGAAAGQFGVPLKILEPPPSVSEKDWSVLSEKEATAEEVANAVANIVITLNNTVAEHAKNNVIAKSLPVRKRNKSSRKSKKKRQSTLHAVPEEQDNNLKNNSENNVLESPQTTEDECDSEPICTGSRRLQKFLKFFKSSRLIS